MSAHLPIATPQYRLLGLLEAEFEPATIPTGKAGIHHEPAENGGYHLVVAGRRRVRVAPVDADGAGAGTGWQVRNLEACVDSPVFGHRAEADRLALRIARVVVL